MNSKKEISMAEESSRSRTVGVLQKVMLVDLERRQQILWNEVSHLQDAIKYRLPLDGTNSYGSSLALLIRIAKAAEELSIEIEADNAERIEFNKWWNKWLAAYKAHELESLALHECFHQVWHAKMLLKSSVIAERLGELHDRLGQQLERTNPDHPNPILRRRAEQGQADKFLCEHVKWVHRDIARFTKYQLGADYPYDEVPATFYSWQYHHSSMQHSFVSHERYEEWKRRALGRSEKQLEPTKFSSLGLSYWMPERLVSHPIIGHELAHQVLQDLYGRKNPHTRLELLDDKLSRTLRRMIHCAEAWLIQREGNRAATQSWTIVREIMCDLFAAERYGCAYLHAWMLEISEVDSLADFMLDSFGMLKHIDFASIDADYIRREIFAPSRAIASTLRPDIYYRGKVLVRFLRKHRRETDAMSDELLSEVNKWLDRFLDLATGVYADVPEGESDHLAYGRQFEYQFAQNLADTISEESGTSSLFLGKQHWLDESAFVAAAQQRWGREDKLTDRCLQRQAMPDWLRDSYIGFIHEFRPKSIAKSPDQKQVRMMHDALWRVEWAIESRAADVPSLDSKGRNELRALSFIAIDSYLHTTGNPHRLLQAIYLSRFDGKPDEAFEQVIRKLTAPSNSIDDAILDRMYQPKWLSDVASESTFSPIVVGDDTVGRAVLRVEASGLRRLLPLEIDEESAKELGFNRARSNVFHLISLKPAASDSAYELIGRKYGKSRHRTLLLGRYDALTIGESPRNERSPRIGARRRLRLMDGRTDQQANEQTEVARSVSRLKRLVPFGAEEIAVGTDQSAAVVMVSLRWDASRLIFARWLRWQLSELKITSDTYLSDGWEDAAVVLPLGKAGEMKQSISRLKDLVEVLNKSALVAGTETLFPQRVLKDDTDLEYRFVCARGADGLRVTKELIASALDNVEPGWKLQNIAGAKDVQIAVPTPLAFNVYKALHDEAAGGHFRVETRVSWADASQPAKRPRRLRPQRTILKGRLGRR